MLGYTIIHIPIYVASYDRVAKLMEGCHVHVFADSTTVSVHVNNNEVVGVIGILDAQGLLING